MAFYVLVVGSTLVLVLALKLLFLQVSRLCVVGELQEQLFSKFADFSRKILDTFRAKKNGTGRESAENQTIRENNEVVRNV